VEAEVTSIDRTLWLDVTKSLALVDATAAVTVTGFVPPAATFDLSKPTGVSQISVQPNAVRPGRTNVKLRMAAILEQYPQQAPFSFRLLPQGDPKTGVELLARDPLQMTVKGPRKARLVMTDGQAVVQRIERSVLDNCTSLEFCIVPRLLDVYGPGTAQDCRFKLTCTSRRFALVNNSLRPGKRQMVSLVLPRRESVPFFRDQTESVDLWVHPEDSRLPVSPVRLRGQITRLAPFRRLLLYLSIAICSVAAVAFIVRLVVKLRESVE